MNVPGDQYALKMRLVDHVYDDQVIDEMTVKIILPEGARSVFANEIKYASLRKARVYRV